MPAHVSENLARLWKSASELNQLADEAAEQIKALSKFLDALNPSIEIVDTAHFCIGRESNTSNRTVSARYVLGYGPDDAGKFGLIVRANVEETDDRGRRIKASSDGTQEWETVWSKRLDQVSRPLRVAAVARLPEFIARLCEQMEKAVAIVNGNLEKVRAPSAELRSALSKPWRNTDFLLRRGLQQLPTLIDEVGKRESRLTTAMPGK
jgi:hypothetical protein